MGYFWLRRLHSISGLVLAFAYFVCFLLPYSAVFSGYESFNLIQLLIKRIPLTAAFDLIIVVPALIFHVSMGLSIIYTSEFNVISHGNYANWMFTLRRITGLILVPFVIYHIYKTKLHFVATDQFLNFAYMQKAMSAGWVQALYVAGAAAASFHIGNGLTSILYKFGITQSKRSRDVTAMVTWVVTLLLAIWGLVIVLSF